jgi:4-hydroxybenzoate polyprenyltransferase
LTPNACRGKAINTGSFIELSQQVKRLIAVLGDFNLTRKRDILYSGIQGANLIKARESTYRHPSTMASVSVSQETVTRGKYDLRDRASGFLTLIRPIFFVLTPLNAASAAVLALGSYPTLTQCLYGFFAVAFASCAINVFNDYTDRGRDKYIWPTRPLPSGRVKPFEALIVVIISLVISLSIAWFSFNPLTFSILLLAIVLGGLYSACLRERVGYLSLPPIVGLIYLGGWAAFSPETLLNSWLPWHLYLLGVVWQTAHIMVYYPLHLIPGARNEPEAKAPLALLFTPSPQVAVSIGVAFTCLTLLLSIWLFFLAPLGALYLALVIAAGIYALLRGLRLLKSVLNRERGIKAFTSLSTFRLVISAAILLTVFLSKI